MAPEKSEDTFSLDDILAEVSSWSDDPQQLTLEESQAATDADTQASSSPVAPKQGDETVLEEEEEWVEENTLAEEARLLAQEVGEKVHRVTRLFKPMVLTPEEAEAWRRKRTVEKSQKNKRVQKMSPTAHTTIEIKNFKGDGPKIISVINQIAEKEAQEKKNETEQESPEKSAEETASGETKETPLEGEEETEEGGTSEGESSDADDTDEPEQPEETDDSPTEPSEEEAEEKAEEDNVIQFPTSKTRTQRWKEWALEQAAARKPRFLGKRTPKERPKRACPADLPPRELASDYGQRLGSLRVRSYVLLVLGLLLLYLTIAADDRLSHVFPMPPLLAPFSVQVWCCVGALLVAMVLAFDALWMGFVSLVHLRPRLETLGLVACLLVLADAITLQFLHLRTQSLPFCGPVVLILTFQMFGLYWTQRNRRLACRTAAAAAEPYLVTMEPKQWNNKAVFRKHEGQPEGFGSQIQDEDCAESHNSRYGMALLIAAIVLGLVSTVLHHQPRLALWGISATCITATTLGGGLSFCLPARKLTRRLAKLGVALAGWYGVYHTPKGAGILLSDSDLFPPGSITIRGEHYFNDYRDEAVISATATLIRHADSGLTPLFHNLLQAVYGEYGTVGEFNRFDNGLEATLGNCHALVGTANFLETMGVDVPAGVRSKNTVLCALDGELAGVFALQYTLHKSIPPGMDAILNGRVTPILTALDFNLVPEALRHQFPLPWDKVVFPQFAQRDKLAHAPRSEQADLVAVVVREGLEPYAAAVTGARRLAKAARFSTIFSALGSVVGLFLSFVLVSAAALSALSAANLSLFLLIWLLPILVITGWVTQF